MKKTILSFLILPFALISYSQIQLKNNSFENWENIGLGPDHMEPVSWNSIKTPIDSPNTSLAPIVWWQSTNAHSGSYSVMLKNIDVSFLIATGTLTNGQVHASISPSNQWIFTVPTDSRYNCPIIFRPDSIAGWYQYYPINHDSLQVRALLHRGSAKVPDIDSINWVGMAFLKSGIATQDHWKRFSTPFVYYNNDDPQFALVILNSGDGFNPKANSTVYFDDIELIYNTPPNAIPVKKAEKIYLYLDNSRQLCMNGLSLTTFKSMRILDVTGRLLWACPITGNQIDLSGINLIRGVYLVTLKNEERAFVQKLMIK